MLKLHNYCHGQNLQSVTLTEKKKSKFIYKKNNNNH